MRHVLFVWHDLFICHMNHQLLEAVTNPYVTYEWVMSRRDSFMNETCLIRHWDMSYSCVIWFFHDSFIRDMTHASVTWLIHMSHESPASWGSNEPICPSNVTWLVWVWHESCKCDMTQAGVTRLSQAWHDSWHLRTCHMSHQLLWDSNGPTSPWHVTWLIHVCDMPHSYVWHDSFICVTWRMQVLNVQCKSDMIYSRWHDSFNWAMIHSSTTWLTSSFFEAVRAPQLLNVWHDSCKCDMTQSDRCHMTHQPPWGSNSPLYLVHVWPA